MVGKGCRGRMHTISSKIFEGDNICGLKGKWLFVGKPLQ